MNNHLLPFRLKVLLTLFCACFLGSLQVRAQVIQTESFESTIFPSPGWRQFQGVTAVSGLWQSQTGALTNPSATPPAGTKALIFNSAIAANNDTAVLISKPFDFSSCGSADPNFEFKMYRDNGFSANNDRVTVFVNSLPTMTGATPVNHQFATNVIHRYYNNLPASVPNTWNTYSFTLPASVYNNGPKKTYIILCAIANGGQNIFIDDFRVTTYPSPMNKNDVSMNVCAQNITSAGAGQVNQWVIGLRCIVGGNSGCGNVSLNTSVKIDSLIFSTAGTTSLADGRNARVFYTGGFNQFSTDYYSPFASGAGYPSKIYGQVIPQLMPYLNFQNNAPCFHLEYDTTYFWLTYDISPNSTNISNKLDAEFVGAKASPSGVCPEPPGSNSSSWLPVQVYSLQGALGIGLNYCIPTYSVGTSRGNYNNNDFINHVEFFTATAPSYINTTTNAVTVQDPASWCYPNCPFAGHPISYELRPNVQGSTVNLTQGVSYTFRAQCGTWYSNNYIQAWIDFNNDGDFTDAGEKLAPSLTSLSALQWQNFTFIIPAAGLTGQRRLRIREVTGVSNIDPCATYTYGETEDYDITFLPNCPSGFKLWLGFNNNWNDPANWCGGIPGPNDSVRIDKGIVPGLVGRSYYHPVIGSNLKAYTDDLYISALDTLEINAASAADTTLSINGDLTNNGKLIVINGYVQNPVSGNGNLTNSIMTPFRGQSPDTRTQMLFSVAELSNMGFVAGDQITGLKFDIYSKGSSGAYNNFTISYGLVPGSTSTLLNSTPLATPNLIYGPQAFSTVAGINQMNLSSPIVWDGVSALVIQFCYDNTASIGGNDLLYITQTTGRKTICVLTSTTGNPGCNLQPGAGVSDNFFLSLGDKRPNVGFILSRPYKKALIKVRGNWTNNNTFLAGNGKVVMDSSSTQMIQGLNTTEFHELEIVKYNSGTVQLQKSITVNDTLYMTFGKLNLNKQSLTINNPSGTNTSGTTTITGPITRTGGFIISEDSLSKVILNTGTGNPFNGVTRVIPFGTSGGIYIPFSMKQISGDPGMFAVSTYGTATNNLPFPPTVMHMNDTGIVGVNNAGGAIDRYWITSKGVAAATVDLTFRWATSEKATITPAFSALSNPPRAYPWRVSSNGIGTWLKTYTTPVNSAAQQMVASPFNQTCTSPFDSLKISGFNWPQLLAGNAPWVTPAESMSNTTIWVVAGSSPAACLGNGTNTLLAQVDSVNPNCNQGSNGGIFISVTGGTQPFQYLWSNGATTQDVTGLTSGTFTVTITDGTGSTKTLSASVQNGTIPATPGAMVGPTRVCPGATSVVYSITPVAGVTKYQWTLPSYMTPVTPLNQPSITVNIGNTVTTANVEVRQGNQCGWSSARIKTVLSVIPVMPGKATGNMSGVCNSVQAYSIMPVQQATIYYWVAPQGATIVSGQGTTNVSISYPSNFVMDTLRIRAGNSCGYSPERKLIVRGKPANPGSITGPTTACNGQTGVNFTILPVYGANTYTWNKPAGATITGGQGTTTVTVTFGPTSGNMSVTATNGCGISGSTSKAVTINCRQDELNSRKFEIYPNPTSNEFTLKGNFANGPVKVKVYDMTGKAVFQGNISEGQKFGSELVPGVYVLNYLEDDIEKNTRIVKM